MSSALSSPSLLADAAVAALVELAVLPVQLAQALRMNDRAALLRARATLGQASLILDRALLPSCFAPNTETPASADH
jgi:hypothetical protein